jgi:hypothetical protein
MANRGLSRHKATATTALAYLFGILMTVVICLVLYIALYTGPFLLVQIVMVALLGASVTASIWYAVSREPRRW